MRREREEVAGQESNRSERRRKRARKSGWDVKPDNVSEGVSTFSSSASSSFGSFPGMGAVMGPAPASVNGFLPLSVPHAMPFQNSLVITPPSESTAVRQQQESMNRQARRVYVGGIPPISEEQLSAFFGQALSQAVDKRDASEIVSGSIVNHEKSFAFVEFYKPEHATLAMGLDGIVLEGNALKVRRPTEYVGMVGSKPQEHAPSLLPGIVSTHVGDTPEKIFIGGLPSNLTDEQVKELLQSYGQLKSFNLVKDSATGLSKGFAFCEYQDPEITDIACEGLNQTHIQDKILVVQRAFMGAKDGVSEANTGASFTNVNGKNIGGLVTGILNLEKPLKSVMTELSTTFEPHTPTRVLTVYNCVSSDTLLNDDDYHDLELDMYEEFSRYGNVLKIVIPRPPRTRHSRSFIPIGGVGRVFVEFSDVDEAKYAFQSFADGKPYGDRYAVVAYFSEKKFNQELFNA